MVDQKQSNKVDHDNDDKKKVKIEVDNHPEHVAPGTYIVSAFKALVGVPADKDLAQLIDGTLTPLDDSASVVIKSGEKFFSHVRHGGSS
jgi:hypothetical protein